MLECGRVYPATAVDRSRMPRGFQGSSGLHSHDPGSHQQLDARRGPGAQGPGEGNLLEGCDLVGEAQVEIVTRTVHTIHISKVRDWLTSGGSPKEIATKRDLLPRGRPPTR